ncbi:MAG: MATE family efflux transporter [Clostridia bacterium]|nr:MATE family efflux transporter [Clostridia bacterium]
MLEMFLVSMVGFVDTVMVSSVGEAAIAAVGITNQPKMIALCIFMSITTAVSALVARRRGEEDRESATQVLRMALAICLAVVVVISVLFVVFAEPIMVLAGAGEDILADATLYFQIVIGGLVFSIVTMIINAAQRGCGNTRISMKTNVVSNLVNMLFNYLLIGGQFGFPKLGVAGAAWATVIGTVVACVMSVRSLYSKNTYIRGNDLLKFSKGGLFDKRNFRSMMDVASSAFVEQIFLRIGFFTFALIVAKLGTTALAAHQIGMNLLSLSFSLGDGLQVAAIALVGQSLGRRRPDMGLIYGAACQRIGLACAAALSTVYVLFGRQIYMLFADDPVVLDYGVLITYFICLILFFQIPQVIFGGALRGAGDTKYTAFVSLISVACARPLLSWVLCYPLGVGLIGAWCGVFLDQFLRFTFFWLRFKKGEWTKIRL